MSVPICKVFPLWTQPGIVKENSQSTPQKYLPFSMIFAENTSRKCLHDGTRNVHYSCLMFQPMIQMTSLWLFMQLVSSSFTALIVL